jgi:hypothetical protein
MFGVEKPPVAHIHQFARFNTEAKRSPLMSRFRRFWLGKANRRQ